MPFDPHDPGASKQTGAVAQAESVGQPDSATHTAGVQASTGSQTMTGKEHPFRSSQMSSVHGSASTQLIRLPAGMLVAQAPPAPQVPLIQVWPAQKMQSSFVAQQI